MSKAALRMSGMMLGAELEAAPGSGHERQDVAILTYMPGPVETDMQRLARSRAPEEFPRFRMFEAFVERGMVVTPDVPARDIVRFVETGEAPVYTER